MSIQSNIQLKICPLFQKEEDIICVDPNCRCKNIVTCYKCGIKNHNQHELADITSLLNEISEKIQSLDSNQIQIQNSKIELIENLIKQSQIIFSEVIQGFEKGIQSIKQIKAEKQLGLAELNMIKNIQKNISSYDVLNNLKPDFIYLNKLNNYTSQEIAQLAQQKNEYMTDSLKEQVQSIINQLNEFLNKQNEQAVLMEQGKRDINSSRIADGMYKWMNKKFVYKSCNDKNGVIYWFGTEFGKNIQFQNPVDLKKIAVYAQQGYHNIRNMNNDKTNDLKVIVDDEKSIQDNVCCCSVAGKSNYFILDLLKFQLSLDTLVLASTYQFQNNHYISDTIIIRGSNDQEIWNTILCKLVKSSEPYKVFQIIDKKKQNYQYFKIQNKGKQLEFALSKVELYGDLIQIKENF